jgi:transcriptional regulator with XRE-family HTH domain
LFRRHSSFVESGRETVERNLQRLRRDRGFSQEELAHRAGVDRSYINLLETGANSASVDMLERLGKALGVKPAAFFDAKPAMRR